MRRQLIALVVTAVVAANGALAGKATAGGNEPAAGATRILFYSKAASWEQKIIHRDGDKLSFIEREMKDFGAANGIEFTFTKDGTLFTGEFLARFDAFLFFTSGDPTSQARNGRGDNYPLMTLDGKKAFLDAIRDGKGFIGCNTANYTFVDPLSPGEPNDPTNVRRYTKMIGAGYMGHNQVQRGFFTYLDRTFPGMEGVPADYAPVDQWYAFKQLAPDMHVIMALDAPKLKGNLYERPPYPIAWARLEGRGRVFYTTMGHAAEIWQEPVFRRMLLGGIRWASGRVDADVSPNLANATPHATEIPERASRYIAGDPPLPNPKFPNFIVHYPRLKPAPPPPGSPKAKRVLVFSKSAGDEHPVAYREAANVCFLEHRLLELGEANRIEFVFSKDGTIFSSDDLSSYDGFLFYTSGDPIDQPRNGRGDNYPLMTPAGKESLLRAVRGGKGFIGVHCALDTFTRPAGSAVDPYAAMLGAACAGVGGERARQVIVTDRRFPGIDEIPAHFAPVQEWYLLRDLRPDLHVILTADGSKLAAEVEHWRKLPVAWARMEGNGRVYYTSLGHDQEMWTNPVFQRMLVGAVRWATGEIDADVSPTSASTR